MFPFHNEYFTLLCCLFIHTCKKLAYLLLESSSCIPMCIFCHYKVLRYVAMGELQDSANICYSASAASSTDPVFNISEFLVKIAVKFMWCFSSVTASTSSSSEKKRMSRRQRKNVKKREKDCSTLHAGFQASPLSSPSSSFTSSSVSASEWPELTCSSGKDPPKVQKKRSGISCRLYVSLCLTDGQIYLHLHNYILDQNTLRTLGFPLGKFQLHYHCTFFNGIADMMFSCLRHVCRISTISWKGLGLPRSRISRLRFRFR